MTSRDVVNVAQRWFPRGTKIGHTGTLDPLATGVLVLCVGAATKHVERIQNMGKTYLTVVRFGATSNTDDSDGIIDATPNAKPPAEDAIRSVITTWIGEVQQVPPAFSALKVEGQRAHDLARRGQDVVLAARPVRIDQIALLRYEWPFAEFEIDCGKGTYVRSLARDWGRALEVGGLVQTLRRTRVGPFTTEGALTVDSAWDAARKKLLPVEAALRSGAINSAAG
jgi:tRNA pseudouridine55 synthase